MKRHIVTLIAPCAALLLLGALAPQKGAAQVDPIATPGAEATVSVTATATITTPLQILTPTVTAPAVATPAATTTREPAGTVTETVIATATPTLAVTATLTEVGGWTATVRTSAGVRLRVRSGPGANYPIVARLANNQTVGLLGQDATGKWLLVEFAGANNDFGWVSAAYMRTNTPVAELPVSSAISTAVPVAGPSGAVTGALTGTMTGTLTGTVTTASAIVPYTGNLPGKIAVPVFDPDKQVYNIWLLEANGSSLRLVVENASSPALSDDGTLLAYRHWQRDDRGIVVANSDGAAPLRLTDKLEDVLPSFSPDKTKLVFSTYRQGDRLSRLYYVWTDEQNRRAWEWGAGGLFGEDPDWMADGQIVFHTNGERDQIWIMNGDATNQRPFFSTGSIAALAAAPDSATVAYMSDEGGSWDIYSVDTQGANLRRLTDDPGQDGLPAWSPDGQSIAFVSDRSGQWALWVMDADGSNEQMLALLPGPVDGRVQFEPDYLNHGWLEEQIAWSW